MLTIRDYRESRLYERWFLVLEEVVSLAIKLSLRVFITINLCEVVDRLGLIHFLDSEGSIATKKYQWKMGFGDFDV